MAISSQALNAALQQPIIIDKETGEAGFSTTFIRFLNELVKNRRVNTGTAQPLTIASGVITLIPGFSNYKIAVETGSSDDLNEIKGLNEGDMVFFKAADSTETIVFKDAVTNILNDGSADLSLDHADDLIIGHYDGSNLKCFILNVG